ncbi:MAG TPA: hypothetical protein VKE74_31460 [Gemmataceae bacterium]|nr:hypothetical protein [Gemmataceae bacterium]
MPALRLLSAAVLLSAAALAPAAPNPVPAERDRPPVLKVLVIDGAPRWEYRHLRTLLERQGEKSPFDPRFLLLSAEPGSLDADKHALRALPDKATLDRFEVVILGDVAAKDLKGQAMQELATFVTVRGGGLVVVAGPHECPHGWKNSDLEDVLPIRLGERPKPPEEQTKGYRPVLTETGKKHPAFAFKPDTDDEVTWDKLPEMYGWAAGYRAKAGAEVLAVHPSEKTEAGDPLPLVVQQRVGKGTCVFVGFDETWRWRLRTTGGWHQHFWTALLQASAPPRGPG